MNISIIVPSYNQSATFEKMLYSLINTNYTYKYEIIIVDSSTSPHKEIIHACINDFKAMGHDYIKLIYISEKTLCGHARNIGIAHSVYDYVAFTDTDCEVDRMWLQNALPYLDNNTFINGIIENGTPENIYGTSLFLFEFNKYIHLNKPYQYNKEAFGAVMIFNKNIVKKAGYFEGIYDDTIFSQNFYNSGGKILQLNNVRVKHNNVTTLKDIINKAYNIGLHSSLMRKKHDRLPKIFHVIPKTAFLLTLYRFITTTTNVFKTPYLTSFIKTIPFILVTAFMWSKGFYDGLK